MPLCKHCRVYLTPLITAMCKPFCTCIVCVCGGGGFKGLTLCNRGGIVVAWDKCLNLNCALCHWLAGGDSSIAPHLPLAATSYSLQWRERCVRRNDSHHPGPWSLPANVKGAGPAGPCGAWPGVCVCVGRCPHTKLVLPFPLPIPCPQLEGHGHGEGRGRSPRRFCCTDAQ